ncbi:MAG: hypothetical protein ACFFB0_20365 [Promethearchaeota archaeon]
MAEKKLFEVFVNKLEFTLADYLIASTEAELSDFQKKAIESATLIMKDNIVEEIKAFGGSLKINEEKFKELEKNASEELENEDYEDLKKELKGYVKKLRDLIEKTCVVIIPVKEMPWMNVMFRTVPRIIFNKKLELLDNAIAYYGEIKCPISRPVIFGKIKGEKPLFAPITGSLDLGGYKIDESQKIPKSEIHSFVSAVIDSLDSILNRNQLAKYHEEFQRHGDPICDFLMRNDELMKAMERITSGLESNRLTSDIAAFAIAVPIPEDNTTLLLVIDEGADPNKYSRCFEALLRFSAECCNAPSTTTTVPIQVPGAMRTPSSPEIKVWTAEELAEEAQKRMSAQPDMPAWTEEDLSKFAAERGTGLPAGMEVWTEEELQDLARKRQGGLDIPEWEADKEMKECVKCGYSLRPGWSKCPICDTPVDAKIEPEPIPEQKQESKEEDHEEPTDKSSDNIEKEEDK